MCGDMLAGVISWGDSGCHVDGVVELPTVAASTGYFYDWISTACEGCVQTNHKLITLQLQLSASRNKHMYFKCVVAQLLLQINIANLLIVFVFDMFVIKHVQK